MKSWPEEFEAVRSGRKMFEVRLNDREFREGDFLVLGKWDPNTKKYLGDALLVRVEYFMEGKFGLPADLCVMSISIV